MDTKQRLIVCLDGTWNNRDDSTNVLHHFAIVREGDMLDADDNPVTQLKYYIKGVGTGALDRLTGGGFGFGLEANVRDAYNWLVQHYRGVRDGKEADEIYIFGFSRGAYTARSLVGFIGRCGLLRRGAPITVNQLWENYCLLGREHEERGSIQDTIFGDDPPKVRQITDLICDPWQIDQYERKRSATAAVHPARVPGQRVDDLNETEQLLVRWSRRARITYLGLYDTVGAMGFDALAIPILKSKLALHHNMRPTTLIQSCRHALAMDEHRSSFSHTPFLAYMGHGDTEEEEQRGDGESQTDPSLRWRRSRAMWWRKIEQRWFVGAHSNVGGGYPDNELAQFPFRWLVEGAAQAVMTRKDGARLNNGLQCEAIPPATPANTLRLRDSYGEFARPFWKMILRAKRHYRPIDPEPESRASRRKSNEESRPPAGFSLQSVNEQVDPSVFDYWQEALAPPNLVDYAKRKLAQDDHSEESKKLPEPLKHSLLIVAARPPQHPWFGETMVGHIVIVMWATLAAVGLAAMHSIVFAQRGALPLGLLCGAAFGFVLVDWTESRADFARAVGRSGPRWRALLDSLYWTRALGVTLFVFGAVASPTHLCALGWKAAATGDPWSQSLGVIERWWLVPVLAGVAVVVVNLLDKASSRRHKSGVATLLGGPLLAVAAVPGVIFLACLFALVFAPVFGFAPAMGASPPKDASFAGLLLLLQFAVAYFLAAFTWVGEPMARANLGKLTGLQLRATPAGVAQCLERWRTMLACRWLDEDATQGPAACRMREILREALWRDIIGFIPAYSVVLGFGAWFAARQLGWDLPNRVCLGVPLWFALPLLATVADYLEDICHLRFLALHELRKQPSLLFTGFSFALTWIKNVIIMAMTAFTLGAIFAASWRVALLIEDTGWRGTLALLISVLTVLLVIVVVASALIYRFTIARNQRARRRAVPTPQSPASHFPIHR